MNTTGELKEEAQAEVEVQRSAGGWPKDPEAQRRRRQLLDGQQEAVRLWSSSRLYSVVALHSRFHLHIGTAVASFQCSAFPPACLLVCAGITKGEGKAESAADSDGRAVSTNSGRWSQAMPPLPVACPRRRRPLLPIARQRR